MDRFRFLDHTADVKFQAFGSTLEDLFSNAALAMAGVMCRETVSPGKSVAVRAEGGDLEGLLYNFLEEFLVLFDSRHFLPVRLDSISLDERKLQLEAVALGDDAANYELYLAVKAVTYNDMFVRRDGDTWIAQVVLDV